MSSIAVLVLAEKHTLMAVLTKIWPGHDELINSLIVLGSLILSGGGLTATYSGRMQAGDVYSPEGLPGKNLKDFYPNE
jgi:hypothetical protein